MNIALQSYQTGVYFHARSACIHGRFAPRPVSENRYRYCHVEARSSFEVADSKGEEPGSADETGSVDLSLGLPLPLHNYQKTLGIKDIKPLRAKSNTMAKEGSLQRIICGQNGITQTFLNACSDALGKHEFLRVKLGEGAGMSRKQASKALEQHLDAVVVHEVGFTITLFRQTGLPRPSNCPAAPSASPQAGAENEPSGTVEEDHLPLPRQRTSLKSAERAAAGKAEAKLRPKEPPQFTVV